MIFEFIKQLLEVLLRVLAIYGVLSLAVSHIVINQCESDHPEHTQCQLEYKATPIKESK